MRPLGYKCSEETKRKISASNKGRLISPKHRSQISKANSGNKYCVGRTASEETRKKLSDSHKGQHSSPATQFVKGQRDNYKGDDYSVIWNTGYRMVRDSRNSRKLSRQHVVLMEKKLGRRLNPGEHVHHINGCKTDNRESNLIVLTASQHRKLHNHMSALYQMEHFAGPNEFLIDNLSEVKKILTESQIGGS